MRGADETGSSEVFIAGSERSVTMHTMSSPSAMGLAALIVMHGLALPAAADDHPARTPAGQSDADPSDAGGRPAPPGPQPGVVVVPAGDAAGLPSDEAQRERARAAARAAPEDGGAPDGEGKRSRDGDPRLSGLEKAREAARKADTGGGKDCMSSREARGAIVAKRVVTLSQALRTARDAWNGEVIDYKLCTFDGALAYDLVLLNREGRVARVRVGAADGKLVGVR